MKSKSVAWDLRHDGVVVDSQARFADNLFLSLLYDFAIVDIPVPEIHALISREVGHPVEVGDVPA